MEGVASAIEKTAPHRASASVAPATRSRRPRRRASAIASSSQPRISAAEMLAVAPAERRTSNLRTKGLLGRVSHQGVAPTVCTTARTPTVGPSGAGRSPAAASTCPMLPMPETWSMSAGVQQTSATTSAAATQTQPLREPLREGACDCCGRAGSPRRRSHHSAAPASPTTSAASAGGTNASSHCSSKLASRAASGSRRYSPQASDQQTNTSASSGKSPAEGFQMS